MIAPVPSPFPRADLDELRSRVARAEYRVEAEELAQAILRRWQLRAIGTRAALAWSDRDTSGAGGPLAS